jgi:glycyl-tRNA synthetase alpha chain
VYNFEDADVERLWAHFNSYEAEAKALLAKGNAVLADENASPAEKRRFPLISTYELALKCSNLFNLLDARGAISVTERVGMIARSRNLAVGVAKVYVGQQNSF